MWSAAGDVTEPLDARERHALCDLFIELGAEAPTLCQGWLTADLAAHLVLREHFRLSPPARISKEKAAGYDHLIARLRTETPYFPWQVPRLRKLASGLEFLVHHEDVRRANGLAPRPPDEERDHFAWAMSGLLARRLARKAKVRLTVESGGRSRRVGHGPKATLRAAPVDLVLYLTGRRLGVDYTLEGDETANRAVEGADARL